MFTLPLQQANTQRIRLNSNFQAGGQQPMLFSQLKSFIEMRKAGGVLAFINRVSNAVMHDVLDGFVFEGVDGPLRRTIDFF